MKIECVEAFTLHYLTASVVALAVFLSMLSTNLAFSLLNWRKGETIDVYTRNKSNK
jgi:hypothetical protein